MVEHVVLEPGLIRLTAPNPSPMTFRGTNTYLLGQGARAVIDPGPSDPGHLEAIVAAAPEGISHIFVTHAHRDHAPLARALSDRTGAPVLAFGPPEAGRSEIMTRLVAEGLVGGGEGIDTGFAPDICLADGAAISGGDWRLTALWTPGHTSNHLSFAWGTRLFSGDHAMGWATSIVSPPDGDMAQFLGSCARLLGRGLSRLYPGHGDPVETPDARLAELIDHRKTRERQILATLATAPARPAELTRQIYTDVAPTLLPMAERNVFAHLIDLTVRGAVKASPKLSPTAIFTRP